MSNPGIPIVNSGLLYVNDLQVSAGPLTAVANIACSTLTIQNGQCRDSTDTNDISLEEGPYTLNINLIGSVNGLDTGNGIGISELYSVYVIGDSRGYKPSGTLLSLSFTRPTLPFGYDMFRHIGTVQSDGTGVGILNFHQRGDGSSRSTWYAVPIATSVAAGNSAVFAPVTVTATVPITASSVFFKSVLTADAGATRTVVYSADATTTIAAAPTAGEVIMSSPASTVTSMSLVVPVKNTAGVMTFQYAVSNAAAAVAVLVQGFMDEL
jgi:hypothetical protein